MRLDEYRKIVLFGAGQDAKWIYSQIPDAPKRIISVVDFIVENSRRNVNEFEGYKVKHYSKENSIFDSDVALVFGIGSWNIVSLCNELIDYIGGNANERLFIPNMYVSLRTFCRPKRFWNEIRISYSDEKYQMVSELFDDEESKKIFDRLVSGCSWDSPNDMYQIVNYSSIKDMLYFSEDYWCTYKFSKEKHGENATIIDGGAYIGDSIVPICNAIPEKNVRYYAFEPGDYCDNIEETWKNSRICGTLNIFKCGLGKENKVVSFSESDVENGGYFDDDNSSSSLDNLVDIKAIDNAELEISGQLYIKFDIEGSELEALEGAKKTIQKNKPIMAICVYHRKNDLVNIPLYINELLPDVYKFYLRGGYHTILWAIPKGM